MTKAVRAALIPLALAAALATSGAHAQRVVTTLDRDWRFNSGDVPEAVAPEFDDAAWQPVSVPHTWNRVGYYLHGQVGTNTPETVNKTQGPAWYRLRFNAAAQPAGHKAWLEFDAASRVAKVWLNGTYLGEHRGGFSRFRFDATAAFKAGAENVLVVRVDNTRPTAGSPTADVLPLTGDFFVHGGLYRPVRLVTTDALHIDMADLGGPGVYAATLAASADSATLAIKARIANGTDRPAPVTVRARLIDREGREVARGAAPARLAARGSDAIETQLAVIRPQLWQGTQDPYLYDLVVELLDAKGQVRDRLVQPFGIRTMGFDAERGFLLNGQPYKLRGVGYHQDRDGKGWAITRADVAEDIATLREMGANSIRLTHYQHGSDVHELADRAGIVVWDEIPLVSAWTLGGKREPDPALVANARQQLSELIRQNYNHAASAIWGLANEVDFGNSLPVFLTGGSDGRELDPLPLLNELQTLARREDPARATALATCCEGRLFASDVAIPITAPAADLGGANRYFGWYYGEPMGLGPHLDALRAQRPSQPLAVTEYGAGGALTIHTDNVLGAPVDSRGRAQPEEYLSYIHETALPQLDARPWLYATWLWNSFDFATTVRAEGDAQDINTKGLVAYDHKTRKDAFYYYKAHWNPAPMVHITGRRYAERAYGVTDIRVYSNLDSTELLLNGRSLGTREACPNRICVWSQVTLDAGANVVRAAGRSAAGPVEDSLTWNLAPQKRNSVVIDAGTLVAAKGDGRLLGSDNWFEGGTAASLDKAADYGRPAQPAAISGTTEREAIASYRSGTFSYRIPVPAGRYDLKLWFAAVPGQGAGGFDVFVNGKRVLKNFSPAATGDGASAVLQSFKVKSGGQVRLDFKAGTRAAQVSLIDLSPRR